MNEPLFQTDDAGQWRPDPFAQGPFDGLQGGGVAALMTAQIETRARAEGWGAPASVTTHFLKPAPLAPLTVTITPLRLGRRVSVIDAAVTAGGATVAVQRATLMAPLDAPMLPEPPPFSTVAPETLTPRPHDMVRKAEWMWAAMDVRQGDDSVVWFRLRRPLTTLDAPYAAALPAADWAHGIRPPLGAATRPAALIPNPDVTVHFLRAPAGDWVGVDPTSAMSRTGVGLGWSDLRDTHGLFGRVAMAIAITPM